MIFEPSESRVYLKAEDPSDFAEMLEERRAAGWVVLALWCVPEAHEYAAVLLRDDNVGGALEAKDGIG